MNESENTIDPKTCKHEPDPTTLTFDKKKGKTATCKHCGRPIRLTKYYRLPGDPPKKARKITSSDRREARRRNYAAAKKTEQE